MITLELIPVTQGIKYSGYFGTHPWGWGWTLSKDRISTRKARKSGCFYEGEREKWVLGKQLAGVLSVALWALCLMRNCNEFKDD